MLTDLSINLAAALIGYLVARSVVWWRRRRRTAAGRRFWAAFPRKVKVVLPVWEREVDGWSSTEVLGPGDVRALLRLERAMIAIDRDCEVVEASKLTVGTGDLVLLGGGDANVWSARFLEQYRGVLEFAFDADQTLHNVKSGYPYGRTPTGEHSRDAGLVVRAPNPFAATGTILLLAGVTGVGTDAAARLVGEDLAGLVELVPGDGNAAIAVVFTVEVIHGAPQVPRIEGWHPLPVVPRTRSEA